MTSQSKPELSIVFPCYNESRNISLIASRLSQFWPDIRFEIVFVNNGSTDTTWDVLQELSLKYEFVSPVQIEKNIGYGHGIFTGLKSAKGTILAYSHADIQTPPEDIIKAFRLYRDQQSEKCIVKGLRENRRKEEVRLTKGLDTIASLVLRYPFRDINGQPKLFSRKFLECLESPPVDFSFDVYLLFKAMQNEYDIVTFPVDFGQRIHGESKWSTSSLRKIRTIFGYIKNIMSFS